jgi:exosome complex RNA-binding protein Rrp4
MAGSAVLLYIGIRLEEDGSLGLNLFKRQKSYADNRRRPREFEEGDYVYLKVSPL